MNRLSACLITLNEEHNLPRALASLAGIADEIVVVDCGSKDRTVGIAREFGAKVIIREWTNFAEQKNAAVAAAGNDWILSLDADEELSPELRDALLAWKEKEPGRAVFEFARRAWYVGGWIHHSGWYPDRQRRLFQRDAARFSGIVHESLQFSGEPGRLDGDLLHFTISSFPEHEEKVERYTTLAAQQMYASGKRSWRAAMWLATPWNWFNSYVLHLGILDRSRGWVISRMAARSTWLKFKKLGELIETERHAERVRKP
jgi:glycosyltransferase involved in cell wall biosynthesis